MSVVPGHLDSLLSETFSGYELYQVAVQTATGPSGPGNDAAPSSISILATEFFGQQQPFTPLFDGLTVVAADDTNNTVTFSASEFAQPAMQFTDYIVGYSTAIAGTTADSYLLSSKPASIVDPLLDQGQYAAADSDLAALTLWMWPPNIAVTFAPSSTGDVITGMQLTGTVVGGMQVVDTTTAQAVVPYGEPYRGPVAGVGEQYINITSDNLDISASAPSWFIHSGSPCMGEWTGGGRLYRPDAARHGTRGADGFADTGRL